MTIIIALESSYSLLLSGQIKSNDKYTYKNGKPNTGPVSLKPVIWVRCVCKRLISDICWFAQIIPYISASGSFSSYP